MVIIVVILTIVSFVALDILIRMAIRKIQEANAHKERENALKVDLKLDYTDDAKSLKHVEVSNPKAWILAVDDEAIVLDSFRKILVLAGYSVDTVENGKEALGLIQKNNYDFVFTDLKMPEVNGLEVTKAVKYLRPDIDVIMITGYASVESAVDTMKHGAMDYVQKPFTEDELVDFVNKSLIRRQDRIEKHIRPAVRLVTSSVKASKERYEFNIPAGVFVSSKHTWINLEMNGMVRVGIDDFVQKNMGLLDNVDLPEVGKALQKGDLLFTIHQQGHSVGIVSPISGQVAAVNQELLEHLEYVQMKPYELGWFCSIEPSKLPEEFQSLRIGSAAIAWYQEEIERYKEVAKLRATVAQDEASVAMSDEAWNTFCRLFLRPVNIQK
ncbi:response regulator [Deltaproteobacteria bacterium TL4]